MLFETARQGPLFALFISIGIMTGIFYDLNYGLRRLKKPVITAFSDLLFCLFVLVLISGGAEHFNSGKIEWFFFFGIFLGFCAERAVLSEFIKKSIDFFAIFLYNLYRCFRESKWAKRILK